MTYPGSIPNTFTDIWQEAANNPNDPRHALAKAMLAKRHPEPPKPEPKTVEPVSESIKAIPAKLGGYQNPNWTDEKQRKLTEAKENLI